MRRRIRVSVGYLQQDRLNIADGKDFVTGRRMQPSTQMDNIFKGSHPGDNLDQTPGPPFFWMSEPCHPPEEPHFGSLYVQPCLFGQYPALMTIGEGRVRRRTSKSRAGPCVSALSSSKQSATALAQAHLSISCPILPSLTNKTLRERVLRLFSSFPSFLWVLNV